MCQEQCSQQAAITNSTAHSHPATSGPNGPLGAMPRARARAPLRLGLAGGGTDVSPYTELHGGAVMNATIDRYIYASITLADDNAVEIESHDLDRRQRLPARAPLPFDGMLDLHKAVYNRVTRDFLGGEMPPLRISTFSEAPAGSGLGSSSTLVVAVLQAMTELLTCRWANTTWPTSPIKSSARIWPWPVDGRTNTPQPSAASISWSSSAATTSSSTRCASSAR